ncbi:MAG: hypothetical protein KAR40_11070 [Candidatus Sabulitectum sp.]|nr:hypothetical protein [Candidatus Sabulitectum sp.]
MNEHKMKKAKSIIEMAALQALDPYDVARSMVKTKGEYFKLTDEECYALAIESMYSITDMKLAFQTEWANAKEII